MGENKYPSYAIEQVTDYAFDLSCFHKESHNRLLAPILICTKASSLKQEIKISKDNVLETICCNEYEIAKYITKISSCSSRTLYIQIIGLTPYICESSFRY